MNSGYLQDLKVVVLKSRLNLNPQIQRLTSFQAYHQIHLQ